MANIQIPNLPAAVSVTGSELLEAVQAGSSVKVTLDQIAALAGAGGASIDELLDSISTVQGAILYRGDSTWSAIAPGTSGQFLTTGGAAANPSWSFAAQPAVSGVIFVDKIGNDANSGTDPSAPVLTVKRAAALAQPGQAILISPGTYAEEWPITLRRDVSVIGNDLRSVNISPASGFAGSDIFLVDSGAYLTGMTFIGHQAGSWAVRFNALADNTALGASGLGAYLFKSPYIQNCTSYTAASGTGEAGSLSEGTAGGGMLVDGAACAPNSPIRSMVVDSYTQVNLDGPGCLVTNDAYAQLVSFFGTFCSYHVKTTLGGQVNLSNSTTDFGTQALVSDGRSATPLFQGTSSGAIIGVNTIDVTSLTTNRLGNSNMPNTGQVFAVGSAYYTVTGAVPIAGGYTVTFYPYLTEASTPGDILYFSQRSQISTGGHTMEYVGAGTNYSALPWNGGIPIPANQITEENGGRVFYSTTDELGNFKVGTQFAVNGTTGEVTINTDSFNISGLNQIGPFSRDGGITTVGVVLMEVSNNTALLASTGAADGNTAPTQFAVKSYLEARYTLTDDLAPVALSGTYGDLTGLPTLGTAAATAATDYATAAQGALADSAVQPGDLATVATTGAYADLSGLPTLGTAAALDVGTSANQVVQLDGSARLPAVDGSQLTNLPGAAGTVSGPASSLDNEIAVFNGTAGTSIKGAGFVMPVADGTSGQALKTDGAGNLSFGDAGSSVAYTKTTFTATAAQTTFTVAYTVGYADVFLNGAKLSTSDYTATNGTSIVLATGAVAGDIVEVLAWTTATIADVVPATGGTFSGDVAFGASIVEQVFALTGTTPALDPSSGTVQTHTLSGATTYTDALSNGEAITLMIDDGAGQAVTWPTMTWINNAGAAPTLATTGYTTIQLWKVSTTLYGALVGDGS